MGSTSDFAVIPALDLKDGIVVHAKGGARADYRPVASPFGAADDPLTIAHGLLAVTGSPVLYVADLDAITGAGSNFELVRGLSYALPDVTVWIDAGFSRRGRLRLLVAAWRDAGDRQRELLRQSRIGGRLQAAFGEIVVLSLDFDSAGQRGPGALFDDPALWPGRVIAMHLGRVGAEQGPDVGWARIARRDGRWPFDLRGRGRSGTRTILPPLPRPARAVRCWRRRCTRETLTQKEIAALLRERRS